MFIISCLLIACSRSKTTLLVYDLNKYNNILMLGVVSINLIALSYGIGTTQGRKKKLLKM